MTMRPSDALDLHAELVCELDKLTAVELFRMQDGGEQAGYIRRAPDPCEDGLVQLIDTSALSDGWRNKRRQWLERDAGFRCVDGIAARARRWPAYLIRSDMMLLARQAGLQLEEGSTCDNWPSSSGIMLFEKHGPWTSAAGFAWDFSLRSSGYGEICFIWRKHPGRMGILPMIVRDIENFFKVPPVSSAHWRTIASIQHLMRSTVEIRRPGLHEVIPEKADRASRRRAEKLGIGVSLINVVKLRRVLVGDKPEPKPGSVEWSHQWIVNGHWRNQWFPSLGPSTSPDAHRQIWIAPHIKGPEDKDLAIKQTVNVLCR